MKKVSKLILRENVEVLQKNEMKHILGGGVYRCFCGMGATASVFNVYADNVEDALYGISHVCTYGGGCF